MRILGKDIFSLLVVVLTFTYTACSKIDSQELAPSTVKVGFALQESGTKTVLDPLTGLFSWEDADKVSLWAESASGDEVLSAQPFSLQARSPRGSLAYFSSVLSSAMPQGSYTYRMTYPAALSYSDGVALFSLPSTQDGLSSGGASIMLSDAIIGPELTPLDNTSPIDQSTLLDFRLHHLLHYLRFYIPQGCNILGEDIEKIVYSMPEGISGDVKVNIKDGSSSIENAVSTQTLLLSQPIGEQEFVSAAIFPPSRTYMESERMNVRIFSRNHYSDLEPIGLGGRNFAAGHITSVALRPQSIGPVYRLILSLDSNNLGEDVQKITLTFPSAITWEGVSYSSMEFTKEDLSVIGIGDSFELRTIEQSEFAALPGQKVTVSYESENAIVSEEITLSAEFGSTVMEVSLNCPYLLFEDFSCIGADFNSGDNHSASNVGDKDPYYIPSGWSVARAGGMAGTAVRLAAHRETGLNNMPSRCDSPLLSGLKDGSTVKLSLSFNYSMNRQEGGLGSKPKLGCTVYVGWTTKTGDLKSGDESGTFPDSFYLNETTGSYTNIDKLFQTTLLDMDNTKRLSIRQENEVKYDATNGTYWLYLDNITVSIAK